MFCWHRNRLASECRRHDSAHLLREQTRSDHRGSQSNILCAFLLLFFLRTNCKNLPRPQKREKLSDDGLESVSPSLPNGGSESVSLITNAKFTFLFA